MIAIEGAGVKKLFVTLNVCSVGYGGHLTGSAPQIQKR